MNITPIYYIEVNLICVIILVLFKHYLSQNSEQFSTANQVFRALLWTTIILCISDAVAAVFRGSMLKGARAILEISNLIFYEAMALAGFLWLVYVFIRIGMIKHLKKGILMWSIPLILFSLVAISNPFTHILFTFDEHNLYHRSVGASLHWVVTWAYLMIPTVVVATHIVREKNKNRRNEWIPFLYFMIAPVVAGVVQMLFYGITSSQVGVTISIVVVSLMEQSNRFSSDSLTGLNNRHSFNEFIASHIQHHLGFDLALFMIDINNFKYINDKFGHLTGDMALKDVASVLRNVLDSTQTKLFVCRYGGDEFLIASFHCSIQEMNMIKEKINEGFKKKNQRNLLDYELSASIGLAKGNITDYEDVEHLLRMADEAMYEEKKNSRKHKTNPFELNSL